MSAGTLTNGRAALSCACAVKSSAMLLSGRPVICSMISTIENASGRSSMVERGALNALISSAVMVRRTGLLSLMGPVTRLMFGQLVCMRMPCMLNGARYSLRAMEDLPMTPSMATSSVSWMWSASPWAIVASSAVMPSLCAALSQLG